MLPVAGKTTHLQPDFPGDWLLKFATFDTGITKGMTEACVKGTYVDAASVSRTFFSCDSIRTTN